MKRQAVGIWKCKACKKVQAGGAYTLKCAPPTAPHPLSIKLLNKYAGCTQLHRRDAGSDLRPRAGYMLYQIMYNTDQKGLGLDA